MSVEICGIMGPTRLESSLKSQNFIKLKFLNYCQRLLILLVSSVLSQINQNMIDFIRLYTNLV